MTNTHTQVHASASSKPAILLSPTRLSPTLLSQAEIRRIIDELMG